MDIIKKIKCLMGFHDLYVAGSFTRELKGLKPGHKQLIEVTFCRNRCGKREEYISGIVGTCSHGQDNGFACGECGFDPS